MSQNRFSIIASFPEKIAILHASFLGVFGSAASSHLFQAYNPSRILEVLPFFHAIYYRNRNCKTPPA